MNSTELYHFDGEPGIAPVIPDDWGEMDPVCEGFCTDCGWFGPVEPEDSTCPRCRSYMEVY